MGSSPEECLLKTKIVDSVRTVSFMAFQFAPFPTLPPQFCSILENQKPEFSMKTSSLAAMEGQALSLWVQGTLKVHGKVPRYDPLNCSPKCAHMCTFSQGEFHLSLQILQVVQDSQPRKKRGSTKNRIQHLCKSR